MRGAGEEVGGDRVSFRLQGEQEVVNGAGKAIETHRAKTAEQAVTVVLTLKKGISPLCHQKA